MSILSNLNDVQKEAVLHNEGPLLILAGAGSGKTRVLTNRIAYMIEEKGIDPRSILAITFTNKAAGEMKERLGKLIGNTVDSLWVLTFHAFCVRILHREINCLGYEKDFVIYDTQDQQNLLKRCLKELNLDDKKYPVRGIAALISKAKNELRDPKQTAMMAATFFEEQAAKVYALYQTKLQINNALDFDDLIMLTVRLFKENPEILEKYQRRFNYILVDEYQDTNHAQYILVNMLAQAQQNLCVVGDDDQSIYGWRGADIRNILDFERDYPETSVLRLEQNYRSTKNILEAANIVIDNNMGRKRKKLWTQNDEGEKLSYFQARDENDEARFIANKINELVNKEKKSYNDFAILLRTNGQFRVIEEWLIRATIPYRVIGGMKFYERKEIKDILAYLKILVNSADSEALRRIVKAPSRGIGDATIGKLEQYAITRGVSIYQALQDYKEISLSGKIAKAVGDFAQIMDTLKKEVDKIPLEALVTTILDKSGYLQELGADESPEAESRLENIKEFLAIAKDYDFKTNNGPLNEFLAQVALITDLDSYNNSDDAVILMTMHGAKGLEFPVVFLAGMEENIFPHSRAILDTVELEEERRLCYVALTRAMEKVFFSRAWQRSLYGNYSYNTPSRFIEELPQHLVEEVNPKEPRKPQGYTTSTNSTIYHEPLGVVEKGQFALGDKVYHAKWGEGVIVKVVGEGAEAELTIAFPQQGLKTLIAKYAPIKAIAK